MPVIVEKYRQQIEKYITGIVNNSDSQLYSIYANPEHVHFLISRSPKLSEEGIATVVAESSQRFINENFDQEINADDTIGSECSSSKSECSSSNSDFSSIKSDSTASLNITGRIFLFNYLVC